MKRVTSLQSPSRVIAPVQHNSFRTKCCSGGEALATLCRIWPARELKHRPLVQATNALLLDQLAGWSLLFNNLAVVMLHCQLGNRRKLSTTILVKQKLSYVINGIIGLDRMDRGVCYWNGRLGFNHQLCQNKYCKNRCSQLPCLTFSITRNSENPPLCVVDMWTGSSVIRRQRGPFAVS